LLLFNYQKAISKYLYYTKTECTQYSDHLYRFKVFGTLKALSRDEIFAALSDPAAMSGKCKSMKPNGFWCQQYISYKIAK
jgi:hypothetical protein